jgi:hypothetical protein
VEDLAAEIKHRQATAAGPAEYVALQYTWAMVSGKAKLDPLDNDHYPAIHPASVAQFAARLGGLLGHPDGQLPAPAGTTPPAVPS